jgi:hypothetical protein
MYSTVLHDEHLTQHCYPCGLYLFIIVEFQTTTTAYMRGVYCQDANAKTQGHRQIVKVSHSR